MTLTNNPFDKLYNTPVELGEITGGGGYSNPHGIYTKHCDIMADIQPYSGGLAAEEYGYNNEVTLRMFCAQNDDLTVGRVARVNGVDYTVKYVESWEIGAVALLDKR